MMIARFEDCSICKGSGEVFDLGKTVLGVFSAGMTFAGDSGEGNKLTTKECDKCCGTGRVVSFVQRSSLEPPQTKETP